MVCIYFSNDRNMYHPRQQQLWGPLGGVLGTGFLYLLFYSSSYLVMSLHNTAFLPQRDVD